MSSMAAVVADKWLISRPDLTGDPIADSKAMCSYTSESYNIIRQLTPKRQRSTDEAQIAEVIHKSCRTLRREFMFRHAEWVYNSLTAGMRTRKTVHQLVSDAAVKYLGLVPTREQLEAESNELQVNKEGYEVDQGIFFHGILRVDRCGTHLLETCLQPTPRAISLVNDFRRGSQMNLGVVNVERKGRAAVVTINNQKYLNAEDEHLLDDLETAVDMTLLDDGCGVGVIRGGFMSHPKYEGKRVFSAGLNLQALVAGQISYVDFMLRREFGVVTKIFRGLSPTHEICNRTDSRRLEKPWIAAVDSFAIGGGAQLLLVVDHVIAERSSYITLPAAQEGIIPGFANLRLTRALGARAARQLLLGERKIVASEDSARLLVDEVVDSCEIESAINRSIARLDHPAVVVNRHMLAMAEERLSAFVEYAAEFALVQAERLYSKDVIDRLTKWRHS
jgi:thioesterase DpgC